MVAGRTDVSVHWEILRSVSLVLTPSRNTRNPDSLGDSSVQSRKTELVVASAVVITGAGGGGLEGMRSMGEMGLTGLLPVLPSLKDAGPVLPSHPEMRRDTDTTKIKMRIKLIDCFLMIFITITSFSFGCLY